MKRLVLGVLITLTTCHYDPDARIAVEAAKTITRDYASQQLKAYAAGADCLVLLIRTKRSFDDAAVETLHYGTGESTTYPGGLQQFAEDRKFRAVAYKDADGGLWTYGSITREEAHSMPVCR